METRGFITARFFSFCNSSNKKLALPPRLPKKRSTINYSNSDITMP